VQELADTHFWEKGARVGNGICPRREAACPVAPGTSPRGQAVDQTEDTLEFSCGAQSMLQSVCGFLLAVLAGGLLVLAAYVCGLTALALLRPPTPPRAAGQQRRFAILVPAHNEEALIGRLLVNLQQLDYPSTKFDTYVVADNCSDDTASLARSHRARVYERFDRTLEGKGFALRWLLERIREGRDRYDAFVVLDADSVVAANFLQSMDSRLEAGSQVIQAYYSVLNTGESPVATLRFVALAALHYLRPLGRSALGLSCGLKGNGMCFAAPVLERFGWEWFALAEDVEFHLALVEEGIRVDFAPETYVLADMPTTLQQADSQNARWERGRLQLLRRRVPRLLVTGLRQRSALRLDAAVEQSIPPLSVPIALGSLCLGASLALGLAVPAALAALGLVGQALYLLIGLRAVHAPPRVYRALAYAPLYMLWKVGLYLRVLGNTRSTRWIRTARTPAVLDAVSVLPTANRASAEPASADGQRRSA